MAKTLVTLIPGDGIGPEVVDATVRVLDAAGAQLEYDRQDAGTGALARFGTPIPDATIEAIRKTGVALKGPLATPIGEGFRSVNVALRKSFDLYANVRPAKSFEGVQTRFSNVDIVVIRENTQGLYSGVEHYVDEERSAAESVAIITRKASDRITRYAFEYARLHGRKEVCLVHKANILKLSQGLFLDRGRAIAREFPDIRFRDLIVDNACMQLVRVPEKFDIIVTTNMFGDIISDLTSGLVGGLGLTAGANIGDKAAIFEAVHGTAPDIAGKGLANPTAVLLAGVDLLNHVGQGDVAVRVVRAIRQALKNPVNHTADLGGTAGTAQYTDAVIRNLAQS
jgi:isocitrate dehydrogenase (NAD+)